MGVVRSLQGLRGGAQSGDPFPGQGKRTGGVRQTQADQLPAMPRKAAEVIGARLTRSRFAVNRRPILMRKLLLSLCALLLLAGGDGGQAAEFCLPRFGG